MELRGNDDEMTRLPLQKSQQQDYHSFIPTYHGDKTWWQLCETLPKTCHMAWSGATTLRHPYIRLFAFMHFQGTIEPQTTIRI